MELYKNEKLVVVITETAIEDSLINDLRELGILGYTVSDVRGEGARGIRTSDLEASRNVRIEIACSEDVLKKIFNKLKTDYFDNYAMFAYCADITTVHNVY